MVTTEIVTIRINHEGAVIELTVAQARKLHVMLGNLLWVRGGKYSPYPLPASPEWRPHWVCMECGTMATISSVALEEALQ